MLRLMGSIPGSGGSMITAAVSVYAVQVKFGQSQL